MGSPKFRTYFNTMFEAHRDQFMQFMILNTAYGQDKRSFKKQFDDEGMKVKAIVHEWEDRLCKQMEKGSNGSYSAKLGEKFQEEVLKYFPYYHEIGVVLRYQ